VPVWPPQHCVCDKDTTNRFAAAHRCDGQALELQAFTFTTLASCSMLLMPAWVLMLAKLPLHAHHATCMQIQGTPAQVVGFGTQR